MKRINTYFVLPVAHALFHGQEVAAHAGTRALYIPVHIDLLSGNPYPIEK